MFSRAEPAATVLNAFHGWIARLVARPLFWILFIAIGLTIPIARSVRLTLPRPLPVLSTVPSFEFTDQNGRRFGSKQLEGKVWVANAIFTSCPTICPISTRRMFQVQHHARGLGTSFHMVSFSVDPENDTPEKMLAYANQNKVSPRMWTFLTGDRKQLSQTLNQGLKLYMGKQGESGDDLMSIGHGSHFVLVDSKMRIRGYYDPSADDAVDLLLRDAGLLATRGE
jgi:protein SCO1/2